ncbi:MAG: V-type proton ATPase subunit E [Candidatus Thorarchaeota archaeon]|nr:MAG: V-type proton ATPase subunit E [Candidatus Thorarchaeota archaeon]
MTGVDKIIEMIHEKAKTKADKIVHEAESQKALRMKSAKQKAEERAEEIRQKAKIEADAELSRYKASAKLKSKYRLLETKEEMIQTALKNMEEKLQKEVKGKKYEEILTRLAVQGGIALGGGKLEIILPTGSKTEPNTTEIAKAISKEADEKASVKIAKDTVRATGGLIIRTVDGTKWVNNTFEGRRERLEKEIRDRVASLLFEN